MACARCRCVLHELEPFLIHLTPRPIRALLPAPRVCHQPLSLPAQEETMILRPGPAVGSRRFDNQPPPLPKSIYASRRALDTGRPTGPEALPKFLLHESARPIRK